MVCCRNGRAIAWFLGAVLGPITLVGAINAQDATEKRESVLHDGRTYTVREHGMPPLRTSGGFQALLPPEGLTNWTIVGGDAEIVREGDTLHGVGSAGRNTFLMSNRPYGDFVLEGEVKINPGGNSGWQVRSHQANPRNPKNGVRGYQLEVDSSDRRWSGGFYDELRRGWIHSLGDDPAAKAAFDATKWNHYRIECSGPHVRSWVNGVPCADVIDFADLNGSIAFQVHSGNCDVRWRNLRIHEIGASSFIDVSPWHQSAGITTLPDRSLRVGPSIKPVSMSTPLPGQGTTFRLHYRLDGEAVVKIRPFQPSEKGFSIQLDSNDSDRDGTVTGLDATESNYPVTATLAGTSGAPDDAHELIIDVEGPRVTILKDGRVWHRSHSTSKIRADIVEIVVPEGTNSIDVLDARVCVRELPAIRN